MPQADLTLVIPCYREAERLPGFLPPLLQLVPKSKVSIAVQVVDDGSPSKEQLALLGYVSSLRQANECLLKPLHYPRNAGKGQAIRTGWKKAATSPWLAFVDADGAIPPEETLRVIEAAVLGGGAASLFSAVRQGLPGVLVHRNPVRAIGSRWFQSWVAMRLDLPIHDTQCGMKVVPGDFFRTRVDEWKENCYAFDLELLLAAHAAELPIVQIPVRWAEQKGSRLGFRSALRLFLDAWRLGRKIRKREMGERKQD